MITQEAGAEIRVTGDESFAETAARELGACGFGTKEIGWRREAGMTEWTCTAFWTFGARDELDAQMKHRRIRANLDDLAARLATE